MKKLCILFLLLISSITLSADIIFLPESIPFSPTVRAQGNAGVAAFQGFDSLFLNPASYSLAPLNTTILSFSSTLYTPIPQLLELWELNKGDSDLEISFDPESTTFQYLNSLITGNGTGTQFSGRVGLIGDSIGLGLFFDFDAFAKGLTLFGAQADVESVAGLIAGYSFPLALPVGTLHMGMSGKISARAYGTLPFTTLIGFIPGISPVEGDSADPLDYPLAIGYGLGFDLGLIYELDQISFGLSLRDVGGPAFGLQEISINEFIGNGFQATGGGDLGNAYVVPMRINGGITYNPDLGGLSVMLDPTFHLDINYPVYLQRAFNPSIYTMLHFGTELKIIDLVRLRMGFNQGYFTGGLGLKLPLLEMNLSWWSEETGYFAGDERKSGVDFEIALRF